jgi:hypothetical protein
MKNWRKLNLSGRPGSWEEFFRFRDRTVEADPPAFEEFLAGRRDEVPKTGAFRRIKKLKTEDWTK